MIQKKKAGKFPTFFSMRSLRRPLAFLSKYRMLPEDNGNKVYDPTYSNRTYEPDDTDNEKNHIAGGSSLNDTVDSPNEVKTEEAKNNLYYPGKIVDNCEKAVLFSHLQILLYVNFLLIRL
jgi:hypothetical protein